MSFSHREARSMIRKAVKRVPAGEEVRHLNITAMMDMMSILLVAFIAQLATSAASQAQSVSLSRSMSKDLLPETAAIVVIAPQAIIVEGKDVVAVKGGQIDPSKKPGGASGEVVPDLTNFLAAFRSVEEERLRKDGMPIPNPPELFIIAHRSTPYRLLFEVMASAFAEPARYRRFRMIVEEHTPLK